MDKQYIPADHEVNSLASPNLDNTSVSPTKVAVVTRDYKKRKYLFSEADDNLKSILKACDNNGCDTVLLSPWTSHRKNYVNFDYKSLFKGLSKVRNIILEFGNMPSEKANSDFQNNTTLLLTNNKMYEAHQTLAFSNPSKDIQNQFSEELPSRVHGETLLMICGEINMAGTVQKNKKVFDKYNFQKKINKSSTSTIINPTHTRMKRYEMAIKRTSLSMKGRLILSYWNTVGNEKAFSICLNGKEISQDDNDCINDIESPIKNVSISVVDLKCLR